MHYEVTTFEAPAQLIAAVRRRILMREIATNWKPALDQVWSFLGRHPGLREAGPVHHRHNLFLYHHGEGRDHPMDVDFGVQVTRAFESEGDVICVEVPGGEVAAATHVGPYSGLKGAHDVIHAWARDHGRKIGTHSWEIYGDWVEDERELESQVVYLLR